MEDKPLSRQRATAALDGESVGLFTDSVPEPDHKLGSGSNLLPISRNALNGAATALVVGLVVAACGGDGGGTVTFTDPERMS